MRVKPGEPCVESGCPELIEGSGNRCSAHTRRNPDRRKVYASRRWRGLRRTVLKENPYCSVAGCNNLATDVHHILALADGGDPYNKAQLEGLCKMHHSAETAREIWGRKSYR